MNAWFFRHALIQRQRQKATGENGRLARIALAFVLVWAAILVEDAMMFGAGAGILSGYRVLGFLLAAVPLVSVLIGIFALRGFR